MRLFLTDKNFELDFLKLFDNDMITKFITTIIKSKFTLSHVIKLIVKHMPLIHFQNDLSTSKEIFSTSIETLFWNLLTIKD